MPKAQKNLRTLSGGPARPTRAALYLRVSAADLNAGLQLDERLRQYARRRGLDVVGIYRDRMSRSHTRYRQLAHLMAHAREKRFDVVVCWSLDRFGGSVLECIRCIQELYNIGIRWVAIHQNLDTGAGTPMARCAMHVLAAVGESQRELNQEKRRAGQRRYQQDLQAGLVGETAHSRSGLDLPPYRPKTILDRERDKVQELRSQDQSIRQIARSVGIGVGTVIRILQEPTESKKD